MTPATPRVARLTLAVERLDGSVAEDAVLQAEYESDDDLLHRGAVLLEHLRQRAGLLHPCAHDALRAMHPATPGEALATFDQGAEP